MFAEQSRSYAVTQFPLRMINLFRFLKANATAEVQVVAASLGDSDLNVLDDREDAGDSFKLDMVMHLWHRVLRSEGIMIK